MAKEIERKFKVVDNSFIDMASDCLHIVQGYLSVNPDATVRVRIVGDRAFLTVKGRNHGVVRDEWEYPIPVADAEQMLSRCCGESVIDKRRYRVPFGALVWEVDVFGGELLGLIVAEVELPSADFVAELPPFVGAEVTGDCRYYNSNLKSQPVADLL